MFSHITPVVALDTLTSVLFDYDQLGDIVSFLLNGPRPAITEDIDDGWNLRVDADEALGLEIFGMKRRLLTDPFYARLFAPAITELEAFTGKSFATDDIRAHAPIGDLPRTAQLLIFLMGQAITRYETIRQVEYQAAARELFATSS